MKINNLKSIFVAAVAILMSNVSYADGWGEFRTRWSEDCSSGNKWIAFAKVKCNFILGWNGGAKEVCEPYCAVKEASIGSTSNTRAYQKTEFGKFCGFKSTGFTTKKRCYRGCSSFDIVNFLGSQLTNDDTAEGPNASESSTIAVSNVSINKTAYSITLTGISGYERINTSDYWGSFKIVVCLTDNDNDSTLTNGKTLWTAEVKLENGVITYNNFSNSEVTLNSTDSGYVMMLNNFNKTIQLENTVNMNRVAVRIITHAEESLASSLPSLLSNKIIIAADEEGVIEINPTAVDASINVKLNSINEVDLSNAVVIIFNEIGKEIYRNNQPFTDNKLKINNLQLSSGNYYFVVSTNNNKIYVKKFIKL